MQCEKLHFTDRGRNNTYEIPMIITVLKIEPDTFLSKADVLNYYQLPPLRPLENVNLNGGLVIDSDPSLTFDFKPVLTLAFDPSAILKFGPGPSFDFDPISILDSVLRLAFDSDSATNHSSDLDEVED
ncbi:hypothetical protein EVAR_95676_1 [Eumeta japonica]|uniref:Uncharacterized protein n=1 Tax=Eumeta variegata TaxID=151549 RepID=A0A4C1VIX4_EUMVA|nr:hypothetical protein EVAR_95676_1 [Eumeta japonica]